MGKIGYFDPDWQASGLVATIRLGKKKKVTNGRV
jgi:hypothetical protein